MNVKHRDLIKLLLFKYKTQEFYMISNIQIKLYNKNLQVVFILKNYPRLY